MPGLGVSFLQKVPMASKRQKAQKGTEESNANQSAQGAPNQSLPKDPFFCASAASQPMTLRYVSLL